MSTDIPNLENAKAIIPDSQFECSSDSSVAYIRVGIHWGQNFVSKLPMEIETGSAGNATFTMYPNQINFGNSGYEPMLVSNSSWAGSTTVSAVTTGIVRQHCLLNARTQASNQQFILKTLSIRIKSQSGAITTRGGRIALGYAPWGVSVSGHSINDLVNTGCFKVYDGALLDADKAVLYHHLPSGWRSSAPSADTSTPTGGAIVMLFIGTLAGVVLDCEVTISGVYVGDNIPKMVPVISDAESWNCAQTCVASSLHPSRTYIEKERSRLVQYVRSEGELHALAKAPESLFGTLLDGSKWLWNAGLKDLIKGAFL